MNSEALQDMLGGITQQVGQYLPNIAAAIGVLFIGWIVAHIVARVVRLAVQKTGVDKHLAGYFPASNNRSDVSRIIGKAVFYLLMLFVLVTFFNVLDLPIVSTPLNGFLNQVFEFAPRVISAGVLGAIGWLIATVVRQLSGKGLEAMDIDMRVASLGQDASALTSAATSAVDDALDTDTSTSFSSTEQAPVSSGDGIKLSKTIPEALYWLVLFLFLPAILGALQMPGLLEPIQGMFNEAMGYLPNIFGAAVILGIGMFVAKIIRQVVSNLAASFGADALATKVGLGGSTKLSNIAGVICYALVLLPILVAALNTLSIDAVTQPASAVLQKITGMIPGLLGGSVVVAIAYFIAKLVAGLVEELLVGVGFDSLPNKIGLRVANTGESTSPSKMVSHLVLVSIMLLSIMQALPMMGLEMLAGHLETFIGFGTNILMGVVILGIGLYLANLAAGFVRESGVANAKQLATVAQAAIVIFTGAIGLQQMGLGTSIVNIAFGTLIGGLGLAAAIAFGWGGRDAAKRICDRYFA